MLSCRPACETGVSACPFRGLCRDLGSVCAWSRSASDTVEWTHPRLYVAETQSLRHIVTGIWYMQSRYIIDTE